MNILKLGLLSSVALISGFAQAPPAFEVASIKSAAPCCAPGQWRESKALDDRIDFRYVTLKYCVAFAYRLKEYQVSGPPWIGELRYDIVAKAPEGTKHDQLPVMVQTLLKERFKLQAHLEKKEYNVYALLVSKTGPKLKESPADPPAAEAASFNLSTATNGVGRLEAKRVDMGALARTLPRLVGRPVTDQTGLTGRYDFELEFSREDANGLFIPPAGTPPQPQSEFGVSIFTSLQRAGLRLEARKLPLDSIVVDSAEKTAIEN